MANKIRINPRKGDVYVIEVNDNGDTIEFDLADMVGLTLRCTRAYQRIDEIVASIPAMEQAIRDAGDDEDALLMKEAEMYSTVFAQMREAMDGFLGTGACQKIFGDRNYLEMFDDLTEQLEPHIKKMGINIQNIQKRVIEKYGKKQTGAVLK